MASVDPWTPHPVTGKPRHRARWRSPDGKARSKVFDQKRPALAYGVKMEAAKLDGSYVDEAAGRVTFKEYAESWLASQVCAESTRKAYRSRLRSVYPTIGDLHLSAIRPSTIRTTVKALDRAASTVRVTLVAVSAVLAAAVDDELIAKNPCRAKSVKAPTQPKRPVEPFTPEQVTGITAAHAERYRAVPVVIVGCGLRQSEVFGLEPEDIDFLGRWVYVRRQRVNGNVLPPKGNKTRRVPLAKWVAEVLAEHLRQFPAEPGRPIFTTIRGKAVHHSVFNETVWKPACKAVGIDSTLRRNGCHRGRHTFASVLLHEGESVAAVAEWMGNTQQVVLETYSHLIPTSEDRTRGVIDRAFSPNRVTTVSRVA